MGSTSLQVGSKYRRMSYTHSKVEKDYKITCIYNCYVNDRYENSAILQIISQIRALNKLEKIN